MKLYFIAFKFFSVSSGVSTLLFLLHLGMERFWKIVEIGYVVCAVIAFIILPVLWLLYLLFLFP